MMRCLGRGLISAERAALLAVDIELEQILLQEISLSSHRTREPQPGLAHPRRLTCCIALGVAALAGCTLTQDSFEPLPVQSSPLTPEGAGGTGAPPDPGVLPSGRVACTDSAECRAGSVCAAGVCLVSSCVGAEDVNACEIEACLDGTCASAACSDGEVGAGESDVDCGGPCGPCSLGAACVVATDCVNGLCVGGVCAEPTCSDAVENQDETATDCGGASCEACPVGQGCASDADCGAGAFCSEARACSPNSCQDGVRNGAEVVTDCGGGECPGCDVGIPCVDGSDCASRACGANGACAAPTCADDVHNQDEVDVDCGGSCPAACGAGRACAEASDCESRVCGAVNCAAGMAQCCQAASCSDGVANGTEPVVDCGNAQCGLCAVGHPCTASAQCQTGSCGAGGLCEVPLVCGDGQQNGLEGDVDCGGAEAACPRCEDGQTCRVDGDCASDNCSQGACVSCGDGLQNGDEAGEDCGGTEPGCPACPRCTPFNSIDLAVPGTVTTLPANSCAQITRFPGYPPTLIESFELGPFPMSFSWSQECSGQSGASTFDRGFHQRQLIGMTLDCPIIFDLRGSAANLGIRYW